MDAAKTIAIPAQTGNPACGGHRCPRLESPTLYKYLKRDIPLLNICLKAGYPRISINNYLKGTF